MGMNWGRSCYPVAFARESSADGIETPQAAPVEWRVPRGRNGGHGAPPTFPISSPFLGKRGATGSNRTGSECAGFRGVSCRMAYSVAYRKRLKIPRNQKLHAGSIPASGTIFQSLADSF